jgi:AcrR family transcriptional regulator
MPEAVKPRRYQSPLRREQAAATRARIVRAAAELFAAQGYSQTSIEQIAARAGVARPTVYTAFTGKPALLKQAGSGELRLPSYDLFSSTEVLSRLAMEKMLAGLSSRRYPAGLEPAGQAVEEAAVQAPRANVIAER